jgi:hypothetical protein
MMRKVAGKDMVDEQKPTPEEGSAKTRWHFASHILKRARPRDRADLDQRDTRNVRGSAPDIVNSVIAVLSPGTISSSQTRDLEIMRSLVSSIREAATEGVITAKEAKAVTEFLVARFVQRRFHGILLDMFDLESLRKCTFHGVTGRVTHGREEETIR